MDEFDRLKRLFLNQDVSCTPDSIDDYHRDALIWFEFIKRTSGQRLLTKQERKSLDLAIEMIVEIEAREQNKGFWFRLMRRSRLLRLATLGK